jgi:lactate permease
MAAAFLCLAALVPIIWLVIALTALKWPAWQASLSALAVTAVMAFAVWKMSVPHLGLAALEGTAMALWPIALVIIAAVFTYNLTVHTGAMDKIQAQLAGLSTDARVLTVLIGWCFGAFLEGMAGFGTAIAIPASMLAGMGLPAVTAVVVCLLANGVPTMFGSIGIPTTTMASLTGLEVTQLSSFQVLGAAPFILAVPFLMVCVAGGGVRALKGVWSLCLTAGIAFVIPEYLTATFVGADLAVVVGAIVSLLACCAWCVVHKTTEKRLEYALPPAHTSAPNAREALLAWLPFILVFVVLLAVSPLNPGLNRALNTFATTVNIYTPQPSSTLTFKWVNTPGVLIFACGIIAGAIQGAGPKAQLTVLGATLKQMAPTVITMVSVLALAKIMGYAGMIAAIASFFVASLGSAYPLVAPVLGALGTFVTGSGTSSSVLFGQVQLQAAEAIGANPYWLVASNAVGVSAGKMLAPQSIAIGCAACDATHETSTIFSKILPYTLAFLVAMALVTFAGALIIPA